MRTIHYSASKLILGLIVSVGMTWLSFWLLGSDRGKAQFAGAIFAVIGPAGVFASLKALWGDRVAVQYDERHLDLTTLWRKRRFAWNEIESIGFTSVSSYAVYGLVKTGTSESLTIQSHSGMPGARSYNLSKLLLDLTGAEYQALAVDLERARSGAPAPSMAAAQRSRAVPQETGFDADAALARYMAKRPAETPDAPMLNGRPLNAAPAVSRFGRKGL